MFEMGDIDFENYNYNPLGSRKRMQMVVHVMEQLAMEEGEVDDDEGFSLDDLDSCDFGNVEESIMKKAEKELRSVNPTMTFFKTTAIENQVALSEQKPIVFQIETEDDIEFHEETIFDSEDENEKEEELEDDDDDEDDQCFYQSRCENSLRGATDNETNDTLKITEDKKPVVKDFFTTEILPVSTLPAFCDYFLGNPAHEIKKCSEAHNCTTALCQPNHKIVKTAKLLNARARKLDPVCQGQGFVILNVNSTLKYLS